MLILDEIYILGAGNEQLGPFKSADVREGLAKGKYRPDQMAFTDGFTNWMPLAVVLNHLEKGAPGGKSSTLLTSKQITRYGSPYLPPKPTYATFQQRFLAWLIDCLILVVFQFIIGLVITVATIGYDYNFSPLLEFFVLILNVCYFPVLESSRMQATIGKRIFRLKVTNLAGKRISFFQGVIRLLGKVLSALICLRGYSAMLGNALFHDTIAKTLVLSK